MSYEEEALAWVNQPCEIENELREIFGDDSFLIADIGACEGLSTIRYLRLFPYAEAVMFEPLKRNFAVIVKNIETFGIRERAVVRNFALSDTVQDKVEFWESFGKPRNHSGSWNPGNKSSSLLTPKEHRKVHGWCKFEKSYININTLDECSCWKFDFIHIDVQGAELKVFEGGKENLKLVKAVWMEVSNQEMYAGQPLRGEVMAYMESHGFNLKKDTSHGKPQGDQLWVR